MDSPTCLLSSHTPADPATLDNHLSSWSWDSDTASADQQPLACTSTADPSALAASLSSIESTLARILSDSATTHVPAAAVTLIRGPTHSIADTSPASLCNRSMQATHVVLSESYTTQIPRLRTHFWDWLAVPYEPLWTTWDDLSTRASTVMSVLSGPATAGDRIRRFVFDSFTIKVKEASLQAADLGGTTWGAGVVLASLIDQHIVQYPAGASILELGSGTGLGGLAAQLVDPSAQVIMTDYHLGVLDTLKVSIAMNLPESSSSPHTIQVHQLDWRWYLDSSSSPSPALPLLPHLDVVMAADVVYERASIPAIHGVLSALVTPESTLVLIVLPMRPRYHEDVDEFENVVASRFCSNQAVIEYKGGYYKVYGNEKAAQVMKGLFH